VIIEDPGVAADPTVDVVAGRAHEPGRWAHVSCHRQAGQSFVEFGLTLIVLTVLLLAVVDFARVFYYDVITSAAANAGVRAAANGAPDNNSSSGGKTVVGVIEAAQGSAPDTVGPDLDVAVTPVQAQRTAGVTPVWTTVTVTYSFEPLTPLMGAMVGSPCPGGLVCVTIERSASQRVRTSCSLANGTPCS
jgi:hypothetical protein